VVRLLAWMLAIALVALPVVAVLNGWIAGDRWPMRRLEVSGPFQRVSAEQVRAAVLPQIENGFFAIRMDPIRNAVAALPWVERVEVRKRWPDQLVISLTEHRPFARWGHDQLLSERGRLFAAPGSPDLQGLPELDGPPERVADVIALYNQAQPLFVGTGQRVQGVSVSDRGSWTLRLHDGVHDDIGVIVGRSDPQGRLGRFAHLLPQLAAARPGQMLLRADLRYTNGFSLTWSPGSGQGVPALPERSRSNQAIPGTGPDLVPPPQALACLRRVRSVHGPQIAGFDDCSIALMQQGRT
jgi:cell division protein FtsQ